MTVLLTRPYDDSVRIAGRLTGIDTLIWPLMQIVPLSLPTIGLMVDDAEAVLFTSAHAARQVAGARNALPAFCVGTSTAKAAEDAGFTRVHDVAGTAEDLAEAVKASGFTRFFYPRGEHVSADMRGLLAEWGADLEEDIVYRAEATDTVPDDAYQALRHGRISAVTVWSARQGAIFAKFAALNSKWRLETADLVAISEKAGAPLQKTGFRRILVASRPDADAMVTLISAAVRQKAD